MDPSEITEFVEIDPLEVHLVGEPASKFSALMAKSKQKGTHKMKKKAMAKKLADLRGQMQALDRPASNRGAMDSAPVADRIHGALFGRNRPFAPFEERVDRARADLQKANAKGDEWEAAAASGELEQAQHQLTTLKMIAAENARLRDPSIMARRLNGQGVPLVSNRRALPDDAGLRFD